MAVINGAVGDKHGTEHSQYNDDEPSAVKQLVLLELLSFVPQRSQSRTCEKGHMDFDHRLNLARQTSNIKAYNCRLHDFVGKAKPSLIASHELIKRGSDALQNIIF
jgi:hypothetical protein